MKQNKTKQDALGWKTKFDHHNLDSDSGFSWQCSFAMVCSATATTAIGFDSLIW